MSGLLSLWSEVVVSLRDVDGNSVYVPNLPLPVFLFLPIISPHLSLFPSSCNLSFLHLIFVPHHPSQSAWPASFHLHTLLAPLVSVPSHCCLVLPRFHRPPSFLSHFLVVVSSSVTLSPFLNFVTLPHLHRATSSPSPCLIFPVLSRGFGLASPFPSCLISLALPHFSQSVQSQSCAISTKFCVVFTVLPHPSRRTLYIDPLLFQPLHVLLVCCK